ncbi:MAG: class I SAM-dependent methyltransferase [Bacteroidota bacterium]|nr:class I SAM-dependent methyltransferase [Bacteroidota bacterium]
MDTNEQLVAAAFTKQSAIFDSLFIGNTIIQYKRQRVRERVQEYLRPGGHILELNSGTGEDAVWFAEKGYRVHATDLSTGMQDVLRNKVAVKGLQDSVSTECCSFTQLSSLKHRGPYDLVFSNFAGLNCTAELASVLNSFQDLLNPGGLVILVIMPKFCLWESALLFKGKFRTAFRRAFSKKGVPARVTGEKFTCWYYNPSFITRTLRNSFHLLSLEGLCSIVPPSYMEGFPEKHPLIYRYLKKKEDRLKNKWPWYHLGDYYIISLKKKV